MKLLLILTSLFFLPLAGLADAGVDVLTNDSGSISDIDFRGLRINNVDQPGSSGQRGSGGPAAKGVESSPSALDSVPLPGGGGGRRVPASQDFPSTISGGNPIGGDRRVVPPSPNEEGRPLPGSGFGSVPPPAGSDSIVGSGSMIGFPGEISAGSSVGSLPSGAPTPGSGPSSVDSTPVGVSLAPGGLEAP